MFAEEEWTDAGSAEQTCPVRTEARTGKHKPISKLCLKRTLQTLGSVPDWQSSKPVEGSDGEHESSPHCPKKKKKKTKKRRKSSSLGTRNEQNVDGGDVEVMKIPAKKPRLKPKQKQQDREGTKGPKTPEKVSSTTEDPTENQLTRQQWKNKIKNKRRRKNKFVNNTEQVTQESVKQEKSELKNVPNEKLASEDTHGIIKPSNKLKSTKIKAVPDKRSNGRTPTEPKTNPCERQKPVKTDPHLQLKAKKLRHALNAHATTNKSNAPQEDEVQDLKKESTDQDEVPDRSSVLRSRMEKRLESARFRYINELLYTSTSAEAKRMFRQDPDSITIYHKGYSAQVKHWPANPVDSIVSFIQKKPSSLVVADFGCGDCKIARSVKNKVHCFDLARVCDLVTVCDMSHVPLPDSSVDVAVFCLSLMGTNITDFLAEANRVLVTGGILKIAEVASRFEDIRQFLGVLSRLGFKLVSKDTENSHFYSFEFSKTQDVSDNVRKIRLELKPCLYKKR